MYMKNFIRLLAVFLALFIISSCAKTGGGNGSRGNAAGSSSGSSWAGIYAGVIPAADCPGISVVVILGENETYKITYQYIEKGDSLFVFTGKFTRDERSSLITLDSREIPPYYKVGENYLIQLDMEGKEIKGNLAGNYRLGKI